jgi:hypothetical protein
MRIIITTGILAICTRDLSDRSCAKRLPLRLQPYRLQLKKMTAITYLPNEILYIIIHMATSDPTSLKTRFGHPLELATYRAKENEHQKKNLRVKLAISLVCKRWNALSVPFLYEHIPCMDDIQLGSLIDYFQKEDEEGTGRRGRWTKRLDLDIHSIK